MQSITIIKIECELCCHHSGHYSVLYGVVTVCEEVKIGLTYRRATIGTDQAGNRSHFNDLSILAVYV